jgi:hypothetical protein
VDRGSCSADCSQLYRLSRADGLRLRNWRKSPFPAIIGTCRACAGRWRGCRAFIALGRVNTACMATGASLACPQILKHGVYASKCCDLQLNAADGFRNPGLGLSPLKVYERLEGVRQLAEHGEDVAEAV